MLDEMEEFKVVYKEIGGAKTWAAWHELQDVYLCTRNRCEAERVAKFLNHSNVTVIVEEDLPIR